MKWTTKTVNGRWHNGAVGERATVVTAAGRKSTGRIVCWTGPAECELDTGVRGTLEERSGS